MSRRRVSARNEAAGLTLLVLLGGLVLWQALNYRPGAAYVYGDQATHAMAALSLAFDGDLRYEKRDLDRFAVATPWEDPHGLLLKKTADGRYFFAKPPLYGLVCAPLARGLGVRGMIITNAMMFCALLALTAVELRRSLPAGWAMALTAALLFLSPYYVFVFTAHPDLFNALLLMSALACARRYSITRQLRFLRYAAALAAIATSEKLPYAVLFLALSPAALRKAPPRHLASAIGAGFLTFGLLSAIPLSQDGRLSSYLGERGYYTRDRGGFPFEPGFDGSVQEGSSDYAGFLSAAVDSEGLLVRLGNLPEMTREGLLGRQTGLIPYFPFLSVLLVLCLMSAPRVQHLCCWLGLLLILGLYAFLFPENTYGGTTSFGSRYALQALPVTIFSLRRDGPLAERLRLHRLWIGLLFAACLLLAVQVVAPAVRNPYGMIARAQAYVASPPLTRFAIEYPQLETIFQGARHYPWVQGSVSVFPVDGIPEFRTEEAFALPADSTQKVVLESRQPILSMTMHFGAASDVDVTTVADGRAHGVRIPAFTTVPHTVRFADHEARIFKKGATHYYQEMEVRVQGGGRATLQSLKPGRAVDLGVLISVQEISSLESLFIAPRRYHLGTELRFTAERPDVAYLGSGWSYAEDWGTWSDGDASVVTLPMTCPAGGELAARFRVGAYVNELRPQATVHVTSRGRELAMWRFAASGVHTRELTMPATDCRQGELVLEFEHEAPSSPQELDRGRDPRRVNMSLVSLAVNPASPEPSRSE